ncbi:MAG: peptidase S41, partial [Planctomycetota bacterium]
VVFRSLRDAGGGVEGRLYTVPVTGGLPTALPMPNSGAGDLSPDGTKVVYSPLSRDFRHWKRYEGGWAQDLYIYDTTTDEHTPLAHSKRTERDPMWIGDTVVFASDRGDRLNLYGADPASGAVVQLTDHTPWDVRWPATDNVSRVVYELNGALRILDLTDGSDTPISITVPDDGLWKRRRRVSVADSISGFGLSPAGERALFVARGEIFSAPVDEGLTRNLTRSSGAHDRDAAWSPRGDLVAFISDASGEDEIWLVDHAGKAPARQLTKGHDGRLNGLDWSPDGARIAFTDYLGKLRVVEVEGGAETLVADDPWWGIGDATWSPDGKHIAFSLRNEAQVQRIHVWTVGTEAPVQVTSDLASCWSPGWSPDGQYLFHLSDRHYAPQISDLEWDYAGNERARIYALALRKDVPHLFPPLDDEVAVATDEEAEDAGEGSEDADDAELEVAIDFDGLAQRVMRVPVGPANYAGLSAIDGHLLYVTTGPFVYGGSGGDTVLHRFSFEEREANEVASGVGGYGLSADGKKLFVAKGGSFELHD